MKPSRRDGPASTGQGDSGFPEAQVRTKVEVEVRQRPAVREVLPCSCVHRREWLAAIAPQRWICHSISRYGQPTQRADNPGEVAGQLAGRGAGTDRPIGRVSIDPAHDRPALPISKVGLADSHDLGHRDSQRGGNVGQPAGFLGNRLRPARLPRQPHQEVITQPEERVTRSRNIQRSKRVAGQVGKGTVDQRAHQWQVDLDLVLV